MSDQTTDLPDPNDPAVLTQHQALVRQHPEFAGSLRELVESGNMSRAEIVRLVDGLGYLDEQPKRRYLAEVDYLFATGAHGRSQRRAPAVTTDAGMSADILA